MFPLSGILYWMLSCCIGYHISLQKRSEGYIFSANAVQQNSYRTQPSVNSSKQHSIWRKIGFFKPHLEAVADNCCKGVNPSIFSPVTLTVNCLYKYPGLHFFIHAFNTCILHVLLVTEATLKLTIALIKATRKNSSSYLYTYKHIGSASC